MAAKVPAIAFVFQPKRKKGQRKVRMHLKGVLEEANREDRGEQNIKG